MEQESVSSLANAGEESIVVDGRRGRIRYMPGSPRTDWPLLLGNVLSRVSDMRRIDKETGEALERVEDTIARVLPTVVPMTDSVKPKKGGCERLGIDVSAYMEVGDWRRQFVIEDTETDSADGEVAA